MDMDLFSNNVGYFGNTIYSSKYMTKTRNFRSVWPHSNIFARCTDEEQFLKSIYQQPVGFDRYFTYCMDCSDLKVILIKFRKKHGKMNYKTLLQKCSKTKINKEDEKPLPRHIIKEYIHKLIHDVIPLPLFGDEKERATFERNVKKILFFGKSQVFSLTMLMNGVRNKNKPYLKSISTHVDKSNLLAKLYLWLLRCFIFAALKCVFYITESNYTNKYLFYEKSTWQRIHQEGFNNMKQSVVGLYKNCIIDRKASKESLYILRILPKRIGSRPLYLKWKRKDEKRATVPRSKIVSRLLRTVAEERFYVVRNSSPTLLHNKWSTLYFNWLSLAKPPVYFVRVDFSDAFGSVDQSKLMQSIDADVRRKNQKEIKFLYRHREIRISIEIVFQIIKNYVTNFVFKHNRFVYVLGKGISQGGPLSSVLCNYYFGEIDLKYLSEFADDDFGFLVRNCDDYLYITLNYEKAKQFLFLMESGFPEYNLKLNHRKTVTNLRNKNLHTVAFNSFKLDVKFFQVYRCYDSYKANSIFHASSFNIIRNPGKLIAKRAVFLCSLKLEAMFFDSSFNLWSTILRNIYEVSFMNAVRFFAFVDAFFSHYNQSFITRCIRVCSIRIADSVSKKMKSNKFNGSAMLQYVILDAFQAKFVTLKNSNRFNTVFKQLAELQLSLCSKFTKQEEENMKTFYDIQDTISLNFIQ